MKVEESIFAKRLKSARLMAGMSMDALCSRIGNVVSKQSISKYESGKMMPDSTTMLALANALNIDVDYLFRPYLFEMDDFRVSFRKKSKVSASETSIIKEKIRDKVERYVNIENVLGIDTCFEKDAYSNARISTMADIYAQAARLRKDWGLGMDAIGNVQTVLENHSIKVVSIDVTDDFDGLSGIVNGKYPIIVLNSNIGSIERRRFTALHELAHILFDDCFDVALKQSDKEKLCNAFANEMLIPSSVFIEAIGENRRDISLNELIELQITFGISIDALMLKAQELNVITHSRCRTYFVKKNTNKAFKDEVERSRYMEPNSKRFVSLVYRAFASEIITASKASSLLNIPLNEVRNSLNLV